MGIWGQDGSDPGAKRNKEIRECVKFSFSLGCHGNCKGGGRGLRVTGLPWLLPSGQRGGGCELRPLGQAEEIELAAMVSWPR